MATTDNIQTEIEKAMVDLAKKVATAASEATALGDKIDALKAVAAVYAALKKHKTDDPDEDQGNGFDFSKGVEPEEPSHDATVTTIRGRRRPG